MAEVAPYIGSHDAAERDAHAFWSQAGAIRARKRVFPSDAAGPIGFRSGESGGRSTNRHPRASMADCTSPSLCALN